MISWTHFAVKKIKPGSYGGPAPPPLNPALVNSIKVVQEEETPENFQ
jgi:hypothetical protein